MAVEAGGFVNLGLGADQVGPGLSDARLGGRIGVAGGGEGVGEGEDEGGERRSGSTAKPRLKQPAWRSRKSSREIDHGSPLSAVSQRRTGRPPACGGAMEAGCAALLARPFPLKQGWDGMAGTGDQTEAQARCCCALSCCKRPGNRGVSTQVPTGLPTQLVGVGQRMAE